MRRFRFLPDAPGGGVTGEDDGPADRGSGPGAHGGVL